VSSELISLPSDSPAAAILREMESSFSSELTPEQSSNKSSIESYLRGGQAPHSALVGSADLASLGGELGFSEGEEVAFSALDLTDQEVLESVLESGLVDLLREVNNSVWVLSQSASRLREGSSELRDLAGALWTISLEEIAKVSGIYRMVHTAPEGRESDWSPEIGARHTSALGLVDQFYQSLLELEGPVRAGREKRRLAHLVTSFLLSMHRLLTSRGEHSSSSRELARAHFAASVSRSRPRVRVVSSGPAIPGGGE